MEVGDYVRTRDGFDRLVSIRKDDNHDYNWYRFGNGKTMTNPENGFVIKSSPNIIDLIEEGDIIKFDFTDINTICEVTKEDDKLGVGWDEDNDFITLTSIDIKSIVTKEQFEGMKYIVEENNK